MNRRDFLQRSIATGAAVTILTPEAAAQIIVPPSESELLQPIIENSQDIRWGSGVLELEGKIISLQISINNDLAGQNAQSLTFGRRTVHIEIESYWEPHSLPLLTGDRYLLNLGTKYGHADVVIDEARVSASVDALTTLYIRGAVLPETSSLIGWDEG